jgi:hypothetical protein
LLCVLKYDSIWGRFYELLKRMCIARWFGEIVCRCLVCPFGLTCELSLKFFFCCWFFYFVELGYKVAFTKVLTIYQLYHTWIHPLHCYFPFPSPNFLNSFNRYHFAFAYMCIHCLHHIHPPNLLPTTTLCWCFSWIAYLLVIVQYAVLPLSPNQGLSLGKSISAFII